MLIIENITKIMQYSFAVHWTCDKVELTKDKKEYQFLLKKKNIGGKICDYTKITLMREPDENISDYKDGFAYPLYLDGVKTNFVVTAHYIKDIINLVNTFSQILKDR